MLEMEIGKIEAFRCVKSEAQICDWHCDGCAFYNEQEGCVNIADILGPCMKDDRLDKKNVIFVYVDPNEIIRERIEKSIDKWSKGDDGRLLPIESTGGDCRIGFKAGYWKRLMSEILQVNVEMPKEPLKDEVQSDLQNA